MPRAIQTVAGYYTGGAAGTGVATPAPGDSLSIINFLSGNGYLAAMSSAGASVDFIRIRSPRMHDANQSIKAWVGSQQQQSLLIDGSDQKMYPADTPTVEIDVTAASTGGVLLTFEYDDMPGSQPTLATWDDIRPRIADLYYAETDLPGGAIGNWSASQALNSVYDDFHAGANYAVLGYTCSANCLGVKITGPDTGNLGIGAPGSSNPWYTKNYFVKKSNNTGRPWIPVIAANNKAATVAQNIDVAANTAVKVSWILAALSS
jgi:hypothetical protein